MLQLRTAAWYGDRLLDLELPPHWQVCELVPNLPPPLDDAQLRCALEQPVGQAPIAQLARGALRPLVIVDDLTRPTPVDRILPHVIEQFSQAGIAARAVTILVAIGAHGPPSPEALARKLGPCASGCRVLVHDMTRDLEQVGRTSFGTPVEVNRALLSSDFVMGIGGVYPQHSVGFGGGSKLVLGVLGRRSITALHYGHPSMDGAYVTDNSFRRDLDEIARLVRLRTLVTLHVDGQRRIVRAVSGDHLQLYPDAVAFSCQQYAAPLPAAADVVIANAYPMDVSLTFARSKGMQPLFMAAPTASRIAVAGCPEGMGCHRLFPFEARPRLGADFVRRLSVTPTRQVPGLVVRRAWRKLGRLRRRAPSVAAPAHPVWVYTPDVQLGQLPSGFVASDDWRTILSAVQHEQRARQEVHVLVYTCAPLQVLT